MCRLSKFRILVKKVIAVVVQPVYFITIYRNTKNVSASIESAYIRRIILKHS